MHVLDLLNENNVQFLSEGEHHHITSGWIGLDCPECSPDSNKIRLGFNLSFSYFSCWVCGYLPFRRTLADILNVPIGKIPYDLEQSDRKFNSIKERHGTLVVPYGVYNLLSCHKDYLSSRGFDPKYLSKTWGIQGIGISNTKLSWCLFIPIYYKGEIVSWSTRSISKTTKRRYINASTKEEVFSPKDILYGIDHVRTSIIVTEGFFDTWRIGLGSVCTMGVNVSNKQLLAISKIPNRYICFDNEPDAQKRARKLAKDLSSFPGKTHVIGLSSVKDAGELKEGSKELIQLRKLIW